MHAALRSVSQTLGLNCSRTSFLRVYTGSICWPQLTFFSHQITGAERTGVIDCVHARRSERLLDINSNCGANYPSRAVLFYFLFYFIFLQPPFLIAEGIASDRWLVHVLNIF